MIFVVKLKNMLSNDFPPASKVDWEKLAQKITQGAELTTHTHDDIAIQPLYDASDLSDDFDNYSELFKRDEKTAWEICQISIDTDFDVLKAEGAGGVLLQILSSPTKSEIKKILETDLNVSIEAGPYSFEVAESLLKDDLGKNKNQTKNISLNLDPLATLARYGQLDRNPEAALLDISDISKKVFEVTISIPAITSIGVDVSIYSEAGATEVEQLSFALLTGELYLKALLDNGLDIDQAARLIEFTVAVTPEMFINISLLRAFRICWHKILEGLSRNGSSIELARDVKLNAITSRSYFSKKDVWMNLLRTTSACFGAALGGANKITILPLDYSSKKDNDTSRRLAANISHLLQRESHLTRVDDPARGSFYLESLTQEIADASWQKYKDLSSKNTMLDLLINGEAKKIVESSWQKQLEDIKSGEKVIIGVTKFHDPAENKEGDKKAEKTELTEVQLLENPAFEMEALVSKNRSVAFED